MNGEKKERNNENKSSKKKLRASQGVRNEEESSLFAMGSCKFQMDTRNRLKVVL